MRRHRRRAVSALAFMLGAVLGGLGGFVLGARAAATAIKAALGKRAEATT